MATFAQLQQYRSKDAVLTDMYTLAANLGVDVVGVQAERLFRAMFEIEASAKSVEDYRRAQIAQAGFLQTVKLANTNIDGSYLAAPNWTDAIAQGFYNLFRAPAVATVGLGALVCGASATPGNVPAGQAIFSSTADTGGIRYRNKYAFVVVPGTTVQVTLQAEQPGIVGNVPVNAITNNEVTLAGCTITNPGTNGSWILTAGVDQESDDNLILRCLGRWAANSYGGARSAYDDWVAEAFTSVGQTPTINRIGVDDGNSNGPGSTDLYLANATGGATATELAIVDAYLQVRRGLGTGPLRVLSAPTLSIPVVATVYGNTEAATLGLANLLALEAVVRPGGVVYWSNIIALLRAPSIPGAYDVKLQTPLADVRLSTYEVPAFNVSIAVSP